MHTLYSDLSFESNTTVHSVAEINRCQTFPHTQHASLINQGPGDKLMMASKIYWILDTRLVYQKHIDSSNMLCQISNLSGQASIQY